MIRLGVGLIALLLGPLPLFAQGPPRTPSVERGACPFECCQLGAWTTPEALAVYASERSSGRPLFTLPQKESFTADSANFYTLALGVIVVRRPMRLSDHLADEGNSALVTRADSIRAATLGRPLAVGDTVYLIGHEPEIGQVVWFKGATVTVSQFWTDDPQFGAQKPAILVRPIRHEWWVRIRSADGRRGWIQAWGRRIDGSDGCG